VPIAVRYSARLRSHRHDHLRVPSIRGTGDDDGTVIGTAAEVTDTIDRYRQAGVEEFIVRDDATTPAVEADDFLLQFQQEVVQLLL